VREVDIPLGAIEELGEWLTRRPNYQGEDEPVFVSDPPNMTPRTRQTCRNVEQRIKDAIKRANIRLDKLGIEPISERVTPHSLRRTYASLRAACGDDPVYIAEQLGHTDMNLTFNIYQKAVKRRAKLSGAHLRELDRALEWASLAGSRLSFASQPAERQQCPNSL
jgi:integrase